MKIIIVNNRVVGPSQKKIQIIDDAYILSPNLVRLEIKYRNIAASWFP